MIIARIYNLRPFQRTTKVRPPSNQVLTNTTGARFTDKQQKKSHLKHMIAIFLFVASPKPSEDFATKWTLPQNKQKTKQNWGRVARESKNSMQLHQYSGSYFCGAQSCSVLPPIHGWRKVIGFGFTMVVRCCFIAYFSRLLGLGQVKVRRVVTEDLPALNFVNFLWKLQ